MAIGVYKRVQERFIYRFLFVNVVMVVVLNLLQWGLFWVMFRDELVATSDWLPRMGILAVAFALIVAVWLVVFVWVGNRMVRAAQRRRRVRQAGVPGRDRSQGAR